MACCKIALKWPLLMNARCLDTNAASQHILDHLACHHVSPSTIGLLRVQIFIVVIIRKKERKKVIQRPYSRKKERRKVIQRPYSKPGWLIGRP